MLPIFKYLGLKFVFLTNIIIMFLILILIFDIKVKYKGYFTGESTYLNYTFERERQSVVLNLKNNFSETSNNIEQFEIDEGNKENKDNKNFKEILENVFSNITSSRFILLIITYLLLLFSNYIISLIYLPFMNYIKHSGFYINIYFHLYLYIFVYSISSFLSGLFFDLKNSKKIIVFIIFISILSIVLFIPCYFLNNIFIDVLSIFNSISLSSVKTIIYPLVYKDFFNNEENNYLISLFIFSDIFIYTFTPYIIKLFCYELIHFIMIFILCISMLIGVYVILTTKIFPKITGNTDNYNSNTNSGKGIQLFDLQNKLPKLSTE
jgi:MFS family permease